MKCCKGNLLNHHKALFANYHVKKYLVVGIFRRDYRYHIGLGNEYGLYDVRVVSHVRKRNGKQRSIKKRKCARKEGRKEGGKQARKEASKEGRKEDTLSANSSIWHSKFLEASKEGRRAVGQLLPAATATASAGEGAAPFFYTLED